MKAQEMNFETKLKKIEEIVELLDRGELGLEKMLEQFEIGVQLSKECRVYLDNAEQKIIEITK